MIIVSQDKRKIINFDNIAHIFIQGDNKSIGYGRMSGSGANELGIYKTEERAKEILNEIVEATTLKQLNGKKLSKEQYDMIINAMQFNIYEMPEE